VTGSNRSGTTWVGEVLCQSGELEYLHEPFNSSLWPRLLDAPLGGHYTYVGPENGADYEAAVDRMLHFRFPVRSQVVEVRSPRDAAKLLRGWGASGIRRSRHRRPLLKDPIALFASEWLADRFDMAVIVMIRHPAAFASSIKRLRWTFDFRHWLAQEHLMQRYLAPMRSDIEGYLRGEPDLVDEAILLWRAFYSVVAQLQERHPDWHYERYEDLAESPAEGFRRLYGSLGLRHDADVAARIAGFSAEGNVKEVPESEKGTVRRDSRAAKWTWTQRLTPEEIDRVRAGVADVADRYYGDDDWAPRAPGPHVP
jgi:hypothetical protein